MYPMNSYWPEYATTGVLTRLTPNPTPGNTNPLTNCTNLAQNLSAHDDGENQRQSEVFMTIW
jgi:hypothetical protein